MKTSRTVLALMTILILIGLAGPVGRAQRFDDIVREDFFAGMAGDMARFNRAMTTCEEALAADNGNAAALVWHGAGLMVRSGLAFRDGKADDGLSLRLRGMQEMDEANAKRPHDLQVLIPRAAILLASARYAPANQAREMAARAAADYEEVLSLERLFFAQLATHPRGELLGGLATAYRLSGNQERALEYLHRISTEIPGSGYARKADAWAADLSSVRQDDHFCLGCHRP